MILFFQKLNKDQRNYSLILFYVLLYYFLRLTCSPYLDWDEAEQFVLAQNFDFGDAHQAPLYSWIVKGLSLPFAYGTTVIVSVRYICLFVFLYFLYKAIRFFHDENDSLFCLNSILALVLTYGYVINFKLTHSVLVFACASFCFYRYLKLLYVKDSTRNYIIFSVSISLGMLAKFNFVFLVLALILGSVFTSRGRALLFNIKSLLTILIVGAFISPYFLWLLKHADKLKAYLSSRSLMESSDYNYILSFFNLIFSALSPVLIYLLVFASIFMISLIKNNLHIKSVLNSFNMRRELTYISLVSYLAPVLIFLFNKAGKLAGGWLAVSHFISVIMIFTILKPFFKEKIKKILQYIFLLVNIVFFMIKASWLFLPDIHPKIHRLNIPYKSFNQRIKKNIDLNSYQFKICDDQIISANLNNLNANNDYLTINTRKEISKLIVENKESSIFLILNRLNLKQKTIDKLEASLENENIAYRSMNYTELYLHSTKKYHNLKIYLINFQD